MAASSAINRPRPEVSSQRLTTSQVATSARPVGIGSSDPVAADRASSGLGVCLLGSRAKERLDSQDHRTVRSLWKGGRMSVCFGSALPQLQSVVEMRDLTMQWGPRPVLDRVNLTLRAGSAWPWWVHRGPASQRCRACWPVCSCPLVVSCACSTKPRHCGWTRPIRRTCGWCFKTLLCWHRSRLRRTLAFCCGNGRSCHGKRFATVFMPPGGGGALRRGPPLCG